MDEILEDDNTRQCITVIEGVPAAKELDATNVNIMDLGGDIFRSDRPFDRVSATPVSAWSSGGPRTASPATSASSSNTAAVAGMSYANVISSGSPPPQFPVTIVPKPFSTATRPKVQYQQVPPQQLDWNPGLRGLDEPITVSIQALENIKKRKDNDKLCNNHFLRGPCTKGDSCLFVHRYNPSADEMNAILVLARQNPCTNGQGCELEDCIYGHHVGAKFSSFRVNDSADVLCPPSAPASRMDCAVIRFASLPKRHIPRERDSRMLTSEQTSA